VIHSLRDFIISGLCLCAYEYVLHLVFSCSIIEGSSKTKTNNCNPSICDWEKLICIPVSPQSLTEFKQEVYYRFSFVIVILFLDIKTHGNPM
jgi:hypothetical protein